MQGAGLTLVQKIIASRTGHVPIVGSYVFVPVDACMASDTTAPQMIRAFRAMGGDRMRNPERLSLVLDHAAPAPTEKIARLHQEIRSFAEQQGCHLYDVGDGICHHLMLDHGHVRGGDIFVGADSHTCTYGAISALAIGVGSTDLAAVLRTGVIWLKVPESLRYELHGRLSPGVTAKDVTLAMIAAIGPSLASYRVVEVGGSFVASASLAERVPLANMGAELGAKTVIVEQDAAHLRPDRDAHYLQRFALNVSELAPKVAVPHAPHQVVDVGAVVGTPVQVAFLGACTNSRLEDLRQAAHILKGKKINKGVRLMVVPATRSILADAIADGTMATLVGAGATLLPSGCGPCVGTHLGVPGDGETVISSGNRNFQGRMGNARAAIFLASPATVAASAISGTISDPRDFIN